MKVTKYTRAGRDGKDIVCPHCKKIIHVYHFAWSSLECQHCFEDVPKLEYGLPQS